MSVCLSDSYNYSLVFDVDVHGLSKADRLMYGESLMTHAMVLTAVHEEVSTFTHLSLYLSGARLPSFLEKRHNLFIYYTEVHL